MRPSSSDEEPTDVLGQVLESMHLQNAGFGRLDLRAPWGLRVAGALAVQLVVVARGHARLEVPTFRKPFELTVGDLVLLPHGGPFTVRDDASSSLIDLPVGDACRVARYRPQQYGGTGAPSTIVLGGFDVTAPSASLLFGQLPRAIHVAGHDAPSLGPTVQLLVAEALSTRPGSTLMRARLMDVLLVQTLRAYIGDGRCSERGMRALGDPHIGAALSTIHRSPESPWTVESLARKVGMSRSAFAAQFKELVGEPPLQYLARWRMTSAAALLRDSHLGLRTIAGRVGYDGEASFLRAFKRWRGQTPGEFRASIERQR